MVKVILVIILFISTFAIADDATKLVDMNKLKDIRSTNDTVGDREPRKFMDSPEYQAERDDGLGPKPTPHCISEHTILDRVGCLQANSLIAKHCRVERRPSKDGRFNPCDDGYKEVYACRDYAVCMKDETRDTKPQMKKSDKQDGVR